MTTETHLQRAGEFLAPFAKGTNNPEANRLDVKIAASDLPAAASALTDASWGYLAAITGMDHGLDVNELEALYHFAKAQQSQLCESVYRARVVQRSRRTVPRSRWRRSSNANSARCLG